MQPVGESADSTDASAPAPAPADPAGDPPPPPTSAAPASPAGDPLANDAGTDPTLPLPGPNGESSGEIAQQVSALECQRLGHSFDEAGTCTYCGVSDLVQRDPPPPAHPAAASIETALELLALGNTKADVAGWLFRNAPGAFASVEEAEKAI
jgi:pyruvate/2-oxoglutarate dehydrogenase complex dihydrolipoamide acyltransferase (E2) component